MKKNKKIVISMERFESLLRKESMVEIAKKIIANDSYLNKDTLITLLTEDHDKYED